jgi:hypothetical protein
MALGWTASEGNSGFLDCICGAVASELRLGFRGLGQGGYGQRSYSAGKGKFCDWYFQRV